MTQEVLHNLREMGLRSLRELESEEGILASSRGEAYGCLFGRDSLIVALELLRTHTQEQENSYYLELVEKILRSVATKQGRRSQLESGEEPGQIIPEYGPDKHEHLPKLVEGPWFV